MKVKVSDCCNALPWKEEIYDALGVCSECKEHACFNTDLDENK